MWDVFQKQFYNPKEKKTISQPHNKSVGQVALIDMTAEKRYSEPL